VIRIGVTAEAYAAIAATLPVGTVVLEPQLDERGQRVIWVEPRILAKLRALLGLGESYSDVILKLAREAA
jgi:hypothetical protein